MMGHDWFFMYKQTTFTRCFIIPAWKTGIFILNKELVSHEPTGIHSLLTSWTEQRGAIVLQRRTRHN